MGMKLRKNITKIPAVHISNPKTQEFQVAKKHNVITTFNNVVFVFLLHFIYILGLMPINQSPIMYKVLC